MPMPSPAMVHAATADQGDIAGQSGSSVAPTPATTSASPTRSRLRRPTSLACACTHAPADHDSVPAVRVVATTTLPARRTSTSASGRKASTAKNANVSSVRTAVAVKAG